MTFINLTKPATGDTVYQDPDVSPAGPRTTTPLDPDTACRNQQLVDQYAEHLYDAPADAILDWARTHAPGAIIVTLSMENTVLAELAAHHLPEADFLFLDTEYHFAETLDVARQVAERYPNQRLITAKAQLSRAQQDKVYGPSLYLTHPTACCRMRKVEPLAVALSLDRTGRLKISPIITWTLEETEQYIEAHDLIRHPLTSQGYPSIGCATCTLPVAPGEDPRAGRWAGNAKTECGLHT